MDIEIVREYCLSKPHVTESFPFDEHTLVFKVMNKMFALIGLANEDPYVNLKCDPDYALELREEYDAIRPGYHMSKKHWNTIDFEGSLSNRFLRELIDHSYDSVVKKMKKADREALEKME